MVDVIRTFNQFRTWRSGIHSSIGLVPTMGNLHDGHLSLLDTSLKENDVSVVTIFVNPKQFGPNEDFDRYPRTLDEDVKKIRAMADHRPVVVFAPKSVDEIYPAGFNTTISVGKDLTGILCGASRPGHFDGVTTVVYQLFALTRPFRAYFGQKDYQQVQVIRRMTHDLGLSVELCMLPIARDKNGLALSSRNQYLNAQEKIEALELSRAIKYITDAIESGQDYNKLLKEILQDSRFEYLEVRNASDLVLDNGKFKEVVVLGAYRLGDTRLIDNTLARKVLMLDNEFHINPESRASLVSIVCPKFEEHKNDTETQRSLIELRELMRTLGIETGYEYVQHRKSIDPATILGSGKLEEIAKKANDEGSNLLVFDFELTASQIRNIKKITGMSVVDRVHIILEIFAKHARTREAKIQIEIARLQYMLPRLSGFWSHLGRQRGGVGVKGGEGEQQIELDRRIIRGRIDHYKKELEAIAKSREQQKKKRQNQAVTAALVGYTNAGKSSLMNRLCRANIQEENKLFATLDSTFRTLNPDTHPPMIMIDTVGFISNLPNTLIDGFKTTLESALEADLLVIVVDISDPNFKKHLQVTNEVLDELGVGDKERIIVFNKKDLLANPIKSKVIKRVYNGSFVVSSFNQEDMNNLRTFIINHFLDKQKRYELFIPYEDGQAHSVVASKCNIVKTVNHEKGIFYRVRIPDFIFNQLGLHKFVLAPDDPQIERLEKAATEIK